jgi:hypothetical protein
MIIICPLFYIYEYLSSWTDRTEANIISIVKLKAVSSTHTVSFNVLRLYVLQVCFFLGALVKLRRSTACVVKFCVSAHLSVRKEQRGSNVMYLDDFTLWRRNFLLNFSTLCI